MASCSACCFVLTVGGCAVQLVLFLCAALAAKHSGSWVRQAENVCFSAVEHLDTEVFESQASGLVGGVRLTHLSGGVRCQDSGPLTDFGCYSDLMTILVSETRGAVMYPSPMTVGVTRLDYPVENMAFNWYHMSRSDDGILTFVQPIYSVQRGEQFRVEYTEVFIDHTLSDNEGISCVAVDFLYLHPWNEPTLTYSVAPAEDVEMGTVPKVLVQ